LPEKETTSGWRSRTWRDRWLPTGTRCRSDSSCVATSEEAAGTRKPGSRGYRFCLRQRVSKTRRGCGTAGLTVPSVPYTMDPAFLPYRLNCQSRIERLVTLKGETCLAIDGRRQVSRPPSAIVHLQAIFRHVCHGLDVEQVAEVE